MSTERLNTCENLTLNSFRSSEEGEGTDLDQFSFADGCTWQLEERLTKLGKFS